MKQTFFKIKSLFSRKERAIETPGRNWKKITLWSIAGLFGTVFLGCLVYAGIAVYQAPKIDEIKTFRFAESTTIYDKTGTHKLFVIHGDENRKIVDIKDISQNMINAILAAEDDQFFSHPGFDLGGIAKAVCHETSSRIGLGNLGGLCPPRGGSTITQQLMKNVLLSNKKKISRKIQEWYLSWQIEKQLPKEEILGLYLNRIDFGRISGVETAAETFFGKKAAELTIAESAILGSIPQRPSYFSPWGNHAFTEITPSAEEIEKNGYASYEDILRLPGDTIIVGLRGKKIALAGGKEVYFPGRADWVLKRMRELEFISEDDYQKATEELATIEFKQFREEIDAPHMVMYTWEVLEEKFGKELVEQGGLTVITTLDYDLQKKAEEIVATRSASNLEKFNAQNAALLSIESKTGNIVAMVGSRDYWDIEHDGNVNVLLQKRLPGSSFKPIVYAAAFLHAGLAPATVLFDVKTNFGNGWTPQNYDGSFSGPVSIRHALGHSLNIPAVKASVITGAEKVVETAKKLGINLERDADFYGNAIALGAGEVRPLDMAQAFSVFANNGKKMPINPILQVRDRQGNILLDNTKPPENPEEALDPQIAYLITDILSDPKARGNGWNSFLQLGDRVNAVKTGTSNKRTEKGIWPLDNWTVGFTPDFTTVVWCGNNDSSVLYRSADGLNVAAPIWKEFMENAHKDLPASTFAVPEGIKIVAVSRFSGKLPLENTDDRLIVRDKFASFNLPKEADNSLQIIEVDRLTGKLPNEFTPPDALEKRVILNFHSYYPDNPAWEGPVQAWVSAAGRELVAAFGVEKFMAEAPTETTTRYTEANSNAKPIITINSPINYGIVTPPIIDVITDISATNGMQKVQFFLDDTLQKEVFSSPYKATLNLPVDSVNGTTHKIKVVAFDDLYYTSSAEIEVKIGTDDSPPEVTIVFPAEGDTLPADATIALLVSAFDARSAVSRVDFYIDGQKIGSTRESPFKVNYKTPSTSGRHDFKVVVFDTAGNQTERTSSFRVGETASGGGAFTILAPRGNLTADQGQTIPVQIGISEEMAGAFESLTVYIQEEGNNKVVIAEFDKNDLSAARVFSTAFALGQKNTEISAKLVFGGKTFFAERITIQARK